MGKLGAYRLYRRTRGDDRLPLGHRQCDDLSRDESPVLGDAFIDLKARKGVGFDECSISDLRIESRRIAFRIESPVNQRNFIVRFAGVNSSQQYRISWNDRPEQEIAGRELIAKGYRVGPLLRANWLRHASTRSLNNAEGNFPAP